MFISVYILWKCIENTNLKNINYLILPILKPFLYFVRTSYDQKVLGLYALVRFIELKSLSVGHLHWVFEKYAVMIGFLCKALLREEGATHLQNGDT